MGVDLNLKVNAGILHYEGRRCNNMRPRESFSWVRESKLFLAKDLAKVYFDEAVYHTFSCFSRCEVRTFWIELKDE